jgi:hypothetical protein
MPRPKKGQEHPRPELGDRIGLLVAIGTTHEHIARILGIGLDTLHKHYKDDLDLGASKAGAVVGGKIFEAAKKGEQWACTLWAARRMGWKEKSETALTGADGEPLEMKVTADATLTGLLDEFAKLKAGSAKPG